MPVAKSYENCDLKGEPFKENGKWYVLILKKGEEKKVRWYTDTEYARMYPAAKGGLVSKDIMMTFNARHAFGFDDAGYITLYRGDNKVVEDWARLTWPPRAWRNETFGFYTPSKINPGAVPAGVEPIKLTWDEVKQDDIHMKSHEEVKRYVDILIGPNITQDNQWAVNDWIEKTVTIRTKETNESRFGAKHKYGMVDSEDNLFVWETGAKDYKVDVAVTLKMKVKEIKENSIVVWYCKEV